MCMCPESLRLIEEIMRHALIPMPERTDPKPNAKQQ